jgi:copper(I)-binding protein
LIEEARRDRSPLAPPLRPAWPPPRRVRRDVAAGWPGTALSACGTGTIAQTANQVPGVPGVNINAGPSGSIQLRNVVVQYKDPAGYAAGSDAPLVVRIFNSGPTAVNLVGVDAPDFTARVVLAGGPAPSPTATTPSPSPSVSPGPTAGPSASASASAVPTTTPTPTQPTLGTPYYSVPVESGSYALLVPGQGPYLLLTGLLKPLKPGDSVPVTFHFNDGTDVTVPVPVDLPAGGVPRGSAEGTPSE